MLEQQKDVTETITVHTKATKKTHTQNNTHPLTLPINKIIISIFEGNSCSIFLKCYKNTLICVLIQAAQGFLTSSQITPSQEIICKGVQRWWRQTTAQPIEALNKIHLTNAGRLNTSMGTVKKKHFFTKVIKVQEFI